MTEFNYLLWCPNCGTRRNFLGGTKSAVCYECGLVVGKKDFFLLRERAREEHEKEEALAGYELMTIEKEERYKLIKRKIVELFELIREDEQEKT